MTIMMTELYDALRSAEGVSDEQARRAAEAVAAFDARFNGLERRIDQFQGDVERRFDHVQAEMERRFDAVDRRFGEVETKLERRIDSVQTALERRIDTLKADTDLKIEDLRSSMRVMQWMLATLVAGMAALLIRSFA